MNAVTAVLTVLFVICQFTFYFWKLSFSSREVPSQNYFSTDHSKHEKSDFVWKNCLRHKTVPHHRGPKRRRFFYTRGEINAFPNTRNIKQINRNREIERIDEKLTCLQYKPKRWLGLIKIIKFETRVLVEYLNNVFYLKCNFIYFNDVFILILLVINFGNIEVIPLTIIGEKQK